MACTLSLSIRCTLKTGTLPQWSNLTSQQSIIAPTILVQMLNSVWKVHWPRSPSRWLLQTLFSQRRAVHAEATESAVTQADAVDLRSSEVRKYIQQRLSRKASSPDVVPQTPVELVASQSILRFVERCCSVYAKSTGNIPNAWYASTQQAILTGNFKFAAIDRAYLRTISRTKHRRFSETWEYGSTVVAQSLHLVLTHMLDATFLPTSHGGRLRGSPHTALHHCFMHWGRGVHWVVRGRWERFRDTVPHRALEAAAARHLGEGPLLDLVVRCMKATICEVRKAGDTLSVPTEGIPKCNPIYPPLVNMLFHPLDEFVQQRAEQLKGGTWYRKQDMLKEHPDLVAAAAAVVVPKPPKGPEDSLDFRPLDPEPDPQQLLQLAQRFARVAQQTLPAGVVDQGAGFADPAKYRRIFYARHLDEFTVAVAGSQELAEQVFQEVQDFCVALNLDPDGVELVPFNHGGVEWLDAVVRPKAVLKHEDTGATVNIPYLTILNALRIKGYLQFRPFTTGHVSQFKGDSYGPMTTRPHAMILQYFNKRLHGLAALYMCASNKSAVRGVLHHLKQCAAATLANKFKLQSMAKAYKKYGRSLTDPWTGLVFHNLNKAVTGPPMFDLDGPVPTFAEAITAPVSIRCITAGRQYRTAALKRILARRKGRHKLPAGWSPVSAATE